MSKVNAMDMKMKVAVCVLHTYVCGGSGTDAIQSHLNSFSGQENVH